MPDDQTHPHYEDDSIVNAETHHEASDVNVRALMWFVVIFVAFAVVTHVLLWLLFKFYVQIGRGAAANTPLTSVARPVDANVPALPRLQPFPSKDAKGQAVEPVRNTPVTDMEGMRAAEASVLTTYGWVDQPRGIARIPIEEAKTLALRSNAFPLSAAARPPAAAVVITGARVSAPAVTQPALPENTTNGPGQ